MNVEKHCIFLDTEKETLLERTVRLIKQYDTDENKTINIFILDTSNTEKYRIQDTNLIVIHSQIFTLQKTPLALETILLYIQNKGILNITNKQILLFGDVFFSEYAIQSIVSKCSNNHILFFGRENASIITKKDYGEIYAILFTNSNINTLLYCFHKLRLLYNKKIIGRIKHWELYRMLQSIPLHIHKITKNFIEIDDFTEDFDYPHDYDKWIYEYTHREKTSM